MRNSSHDFNESMESVRMDDSITPTPPPVVPVVPAPTDITPIGITLPASTTDYRQVDVDTRPVKMTVGYKCGKCCGSFCDVRGACCCTGPGGKSVCICTPASTTSGVAMGSMAGAAATGMVAACMACCMFCDPRSCMPPKCMCGTMRCIDATGITAGGFVGLAAACGIQLAIMALSDAFCGRITKCMGCTNFSQGFDDKAE